MYRSDITEQRLSSANTPSNTTAILSQSSRELFSGEFVSKPFPKSPSPNPCVSRFPVSQAWKTNSAGGKQAAIRTSIGDSVGESDVRCASLGTGSWELTAVLLRLNRNATWTGQQSGPKTQSAIIHLGKSQPDASARDRSKTEIPSLTRRARQAIVLTPLNVETLNGETNNELPWDGQAPILWPAT